MLNANKLLVINKVGSIENNNKLIKKFIVPKARKLFKSKKSKNKNLAKSKKMLKIRNLPKFNVKKIGINFLIMNPRTALNC